MWVGRCRIVRDLVAAATLVAMATALPLAASADPGSTSTENGKPGDHSMGSQIEKYEGSGPTPRRAAPRTRALTVDVGVPGLDVSSHDGVTDWSSRWADGYRFVWVKATEATSYVNPLFSGQYSGSAAQGLLRGAYHFAIPSSSSGTDQAKYFSDNGGGWSRDGATLPGALDLEYNPYKGGVCYGLSQAQMVAWIKDFNTYYANRWGRYPIIYTSTSWWNRCVGSSVADTNALWVARYASAVGALPINWSTHTVWQHSDTGYDQNFFNGSIAQLSSFAGASNPARGYSVSGAIGVKYNTVRKALGEPTAAAVRRGDGGYYQTFTRGVITYSSRTGAHEFHGAINARWRSLGVETAFSRLGYATSDGNSFVAFSRGGIVNNPGRGRAFLVEGAIFRKLQTAGGTPRLGYPKSDEVNGRGNGVRRMNWFEAGAITWDVNGRTAVVRGAIHKTWAYRGSERSRYGRPISDEYRLGKRTAQNFSNHYRLEYQGGTVREVRA
ncbi:hypothetical protein C0Z11_00870 [Acidipropionibacterium jensenii]|nr:hypothetical protein C0Z11_00870 [Acidipropionibacterium jensenii]